MKKSEPKFKLGDIVRITDADLRYMTYDSWFREHAPILETDYLETQSKREEDLYLYTTFYVVAAVGKHLESDYMLEPCTLYAIKDIDHNTLLIHEDGLRLHRIGGI